MGRTESKGKLKKIKAKTKNKPKVVL